MSKNVRLAVIILLQELVLIIFLCKHDACGRFITPLEQAGNTPTWEENFPFGRIQNIQVDMIFERQSTDQMNVFTVPGSIYIGHKNCYWSEVQFNHVYHLPGEVWAKTIEYDVLSLELNSGERTHFIRPIRGSSDAKAFLYLAGASNQTRVYCVDDVNGWRLDNYSTLTGPPYGWTHIIYSYYWSDGKGYCTLAVNNEVHEWVATIADPQRSSTWEQDTNWSWEWSSEEDNGNNLGKYFANIRAYPDYLTKAQVESVLSGRLDSYLAMLNSLPQPATSGISFVQIGKSFNGSYMSYAMIYAEQTGPGTIYFDGSWSGGWKAMSFSWNFGDGNTGTGRTVSHTYASAGNYNVTLTVDCPVWYGSGHEIDSSTKTVTVRDMPLLMITSPNGNETWVGNTQHNITWHAEPGVGNIVLEYSGDWGWIWDQIASGVNPSLGQYSWTVPVKNSNTVRIRIREADNDPQDLSDADFKILAQADTTPPGAPGAVRDGTSTVDISSTTSTTQLSANWTAATDAESGISAYKYAIGTTAGGTNTLGWQNLGNVLTVTKSGLNLTDGTRYYFTVKAVNGVSLESAQATNSNGQTVSISTVTPPDTTPPGVPAAVRDGTSASADSSYTTSTTQLSANWNAATDNESAITLYEYSIGTTTGGANIRGWTPNGTNLSVTASGMGLAVGTTYYFSARATSTGGTGPAGNSNGQFVAAVDTTIPTTPGTSNYPNPFSLSGSQPMTFVISAQSQGELKIYTMNGKLVRTKTGTGTITWDGTNEDGEKVARGIYIYIITDQNGSTTGKISVTR